MNIAQFFEHWQITENPFRGEEARHDSVFARIGLGARGLPAATHSDFEKILGELSRPSTSIVFGEKGSGKTAIRMQLAQRVLDRNRQAPDARTFQVAYDDLNPFLDALHARIGGKDVAASLRAIRLVDHIDAIIALAVTDVVDDLLGRSGGEPLNDLGPNRQRVVRNLDLDLKQQFRVLQALYDLRDADGHRAVRLRRALRVRPSREAVAWNAALLLGWTPPVALVAWVLLSKPEGLLGTAAGYLAMGLGVGYLTLALKRLVWDRFSLRRLARRLSKQRRVLPRADLSYVHCLEHLPGALLRSADRDDSDATRYAHFQTLQSVLSGFGFTGVLVLVDRVDEPTLVNGDPERMQAIVWPMLNNKFLQQERLGLKLLLPIELRYSLFRESSSFFQEARLDKQSLIERLSWTGAMLYDLCSARLKACRPSEAEPISLLDLFADDVTRQDLVDALDQMHQPRDALKFLYRCLNEHCSNVTAEENQWRVPRLVLENVRRQEADRVQQLYRGIRPA
ncbi:MAG: hypothetical protein DYG94_07665 [Leptolyngbya sp. PLA3]|nr:MAG: hypothetical protein EDM82_10430 [Cyanobacteria bacterium CYA]MCE7968607.1 hypothetical protein [Leptolyngbya sp. PL-A3]